MSVLLGILLGVMTTLSDGMFHTSYETKVNASVDACNAVVDTMIYYLQTNPEKLSKRFFAGLGMQEDKAKNAFYLVWKESSYDAERDYSRLVLDVLVDEKPFLRDVVIESTVVDSMAGARRDITASLAMDVHVKFGWFFRIFISRKVYSDTVDWRLVRFVQNLKLTAEGIVPTDEYWRNFKGGV